MWKHKFKWLLTGLALLVTTLLLFSYQPESERPTYAHSYSQHERLTKEEITSSTFTTLEERQTAPELTKEMIKEKTEAFIDQLVQETNENYRVVNFSTKAALIEQFDGIATQEVVAPYIEFYYDERDDGLYIVPTELPPWFILEEPYQKEVLDDGLIKIIQENSLEMYGDYRIEIVFAYEKGWRIIDINHPHIEEDVTDSSDII
ncbi:hypothetical protein [Amphibacillus cookii]|uniref:hypothetical protein n=1 Tax=Amphibacillus cookii TaxID=767787 RepID=UPI00195AA6CF|nr:hypothetical protein [Amphibacillus cookii]MBM7541409.1 hypothetical protein [Amphibacillus cookii]